MWISSIALKHYRNYHNITLSFSQHLNIFLGQNAQGKTNILESIYFLSLTRSHRTRSDKDLIQFSQKELKVSGNIHRINGNLPIEIILSDKGRITKVNHLKQAKISDYIGHMTVVLFAPEDLQLIKGSPSLRRKFIDIDLGQMKMIYLSDLSHYNHILKQRNTYLKSANAIDLQFLDVLDEQLANLGSKVMKHRTDFINHLEIEANKHHSNISNGKEKINITYIPSVNSQTLEDLQTEFYALLKNNRQKDLIKKTTSIGPHRDDISFQINGIDAKFASQGQHRSLILSLKLAEIDLIKNITGDYPILLLDDVMSELDNTRQLKLLENIKENVQTFITTTSLDHLINLPDSIKIFQIENGTIKV
ncbi:MAG: DNA replication/repair protein RecF [Streptococcus sp.]|nr:DNA replication/repair protein RecF [Streptococcus sp.]